MLVGTDVSLLGCELVRRYCLTGCWWVQLAGVKLLCLHVVRPSVAMPENLAQPWWHKFSAPCCAVLCALCRSLRVPRMLLLLRRTTMRQSGSRQPSSG